MSPLSFWRPGHSGDKSDKPPHSKRAVIAHLHLIKAAPEASRTSNYTPLGRVQLEVGVKRRDRRECEKLYFKSMTSKRSKFMALLLATNSTN